MVGAGHQRDELVAVGRGDAGVVERLGAEIRDGVVEVRLVRRKIGNSRQVDRHHAYGAGRFAAAEEAAALFAQLAQIQPQAKEKLRRSLSAFGMI